MIKYKKMVINITNCITNTRPFVNKIKTWQI